MTMKTNDIATLAIVVTVCLCLLLIVVAPLFGATVPEAVMVFVFGIVSAAVTVFIYQKGSSAGEQKTLATLATLSGTPSLGTLSGQTDEAMWEKALAEYRLRVAKSGAFAQMKSESQGRP